MVEDYMNGAPKQTWTREGLLVWVTPAEVPGKLNVLNWKNYNTILMQIFITCKDFHSVFNVLNVSKT